MHSLLGSIYEGKGNAPGALTEYEAAKKACGQCNEPGQPIAYFNVGAAYASASPAAKERGDERASGLPEDRLQGGRGRRGTRISVRSRSSTRPSSAGCSSRIVSASFAGATVPLAGHRPLRAASLEGRARARGARRLARVGAGRVAGKTGPGPILPRVREHGALTCPLPLIPLRLREVLTTNGPRRGFPTCRSPREPAFYRLMTTEGVHGPSGAFFVPRDRPRLAKPGRGARERYRGWRLEQRRRRRSSTFASAASSRRSFSPGVKALKHFQDAYKLNPGAHRGARERARDLLGPRRS